MAKFWPGFHCHRSANAPIGATASRGRSILTYKQPPIIAGGRAICSADLFKMLSRRDLLVNYDRPNKAEWEVECLKDANLALKSRLKKEEKTKGEWRTLANSLDRDRDELKKRVDDLRILLGIKERQSEMLREENAFMQDEFGRSK